MSPTPITSPALFFRRRDGAPAEPLNAATFHQVSRTIHDVIMDLQGLSIAHTSKAERLDRQSIHEEVQAATRTLTNLSEFLARVQDAPTPFTCQRCAGRGWTELPSDGYERRQCEGCDGAGVVEEAYR